MSDETWPEAPALPERPWRALPPELVATLGSELDVLGDETIAAIGAEIAEYARPLEGRFGRNLRRGVQESLRRFVALVGDATAPAGPLPPIYRQLGAGEWRDGRSLDALQAAYRLGARVAWRRLGAAAAAEGASPDTLRLLAESIFAYIDELAGESVAGYAEAQAAEAGAREGRRRALAELLVLSPPADPDALAAAARSAGWRLPGRSRRSSSLGLRTTSSPRRSTRRRSASPTSSWCPILVGRDVARPSSGCWRDTWPRSGQPSRHERRRGRFAGRARRWRSSRWTTTGRSSPRIASSIWRWPTAPSLSRHCALGGWRHSTRCRPVGGIGSRRRSAPGWHTTGSAPGAAAELRLHPQTVRYRLAQLREVLPDQIDDPAARLELALALRAPPGLPRSGPRARPCRSRRVPRAASVPRRHARAEMSHRRSG